MSKLRWPTFLKRLRWLDGTPLARHVEPYRARIFAQALDTFDDAGRPVFNLIVTGRAKKNWKSADLALAALFCLVSESPAGHDSECYVLANDADQARDDLSLAKKLVKANAALQEWLTVKRDSIERRDGCGFLEVLPAGDVVGTHGKSYRFVGYDEIHGYRNWDTFEAMQPDPHRLDAQQWITSYASLFHRPGVPLYDLCAMGRAGTDSRTLFSWYAADYTTDPDFADCDPEQRANPSMKSWADPHYLDQQRRRLPAHKFRRLHLNLPGLPEGSAFQPEPIANAIERGVKGREPMVGLEYKAFVDMSGGSSDDAVLAIAHRDADGRAVVDCVLNQGNPPPFDPAKAVSRFVDVLRQYGISSVTGDRFAGNTFAAAFEALGIAYRVSDKTRSQLYESLKPHLNGHRAVLLDEPQVETQLLGLVWRGGKIDHPPGEHDDWSNAVAGAVHEVLREEGLSRCAWCGGDCALVCLKMAGAPTPGIDPHQENDRAFEQAQKDSAELVERMVSTYGAYFPTGRR